MAEYERLIIPVDILNGENSEKVLGGIVQRLEEIATVSNSVGYTTKEYNALSREFKDCAKNISIYSKLTQDINKTNASSAMQQEKVAQAMQKTSQEAQRTAQALEKTKAMQNANALSIEKLNTQVAKTTLIEQRAETAALRHAQALERQAQAARQAAMPYNSLNKALQEQALKLKNALVEGGRNQQTLELMANRYKRLRGELDTANARFNALTSSIQQTRTAGMAFASFLGNLAADLIQRLVSSLGRMVQEISKAGVALDGITNTFAAGARGWRQGGAEMEWVANTA